MVEDKIYIFLSSTTIIAYRNTNASIPDVSYQTWKAKMRQDGRFRPGLQPWHKPPPPSKEAIVAAADERSWKIVAVKEMVNAV